MASIVLFEFSENFTKLEVVSLEDTPFNAILISTGYFQDVDLEL
jgi:hypothetical protein